jgi:hypothetical protein
MQKLNVAAKKLSTGKWHTWGYGTKFDDKDGKEGNLVLKFKGEQLHALSEAVKTGEVQVNQYGYVEFAVFKDTYSNNNASPLSKPVLKVETPVIDADSIPF